MKRLITAVIISLLLVFFCLSAQFIVKEKIDDFKAKITTIENLTYEKSQEVFKISEQFEKEFHKNESILALFVNHEKLEELKKSLSKITAYSKLADFSFLYIECEEAAIIMEDILEDQQFHVHTVF